MEQKNGKETVIFGNWESLSLLMIGICTQLFLGLPRIMAEVSGTAGWIHTIYVSVLAIVLFRIGSKLYEPFAGMDILDVGQLIAGAAGRILTGIIIVAYFIYITSVVIREFSENLKTISFNLSPISFVGILLLLGMVAGAYSGIESIVRFSAIAVPAIFLGYVIIIAGVLPYADISRIFPIMGNGVGEIFLKGINKISIFSGIIYLYLIAPYIKTYKHFSKTGYKGLLISGAILSGGVLVYLLVYQYPNAIENFLPFYQLARIISFGRFFERLESLFLAVWTTSALLYLGANLFFITFLFKKTFGLEYYRPLIIPFAIILFNLSLLPPNLTSAMELEAEYFRSYAWIVSFGLVLSMLFIAKIMKKNGKEKQQNK